MVEQTQQQAPQKSQDRVPSWMVITGGICFVLALLGFWFLAILGIIIGIVIIVKYPKKKIHGIIPLVANLLVLIFYLWILYALFRIF